MNYKLAKQLKDAGFSQKDHYDENDNLVQFYNNGEFVSIPTLSELIEACRQLTINDLVIWEANGNWFAGIKEMPKKEYTVLSDTHTMEVPYEKYKIGETPQEALAKLWLKLNKK